MNTTSIKCTKVVINQYHTGGVSEKKKQETTRKPVAKYFSLITEEEVYLPLTKGLTLSELSLGLYSLYGITTSNSLVEWIWSTDTGK